MLVFLIVDVVCLQACSEYHYLLLYADKLVALNQISGKVAAEVNWGPGSHTPSISGKDTTRCAGLDTDCQLASAGRNAASQKQQPCEGCSRDAAQAAMPLHVACTLGCTLHAVKCCDMPRCAELWWCILQARPCSNTVDTACTLSCSCMQCSVVVC